MRRCHRRGHKNILKRQLLHVSAFNLSLIPRKWLGAGTPELKNRAGQVFSRLFFSLLVLRQVVPRIWLHPPGAGSCKKPSRSCGTSDHRPRVFNPSATGC
jgi:transposase